MDERRTIMEAILGVLGVKTKTDGDADEQVDDDWEPNVRDPRAMSELIQEVRRTGTQDRM